MRNEKSIAHIKIKNTKTLLCIAVKEIKQKEIILKKTCVLVFVRSITFQTILVETG